MQASQLRRIYYAVKHGRDGNTVCITWDDVRGIFAEDQEISP